VTGAVLPDPVICLVTDRRQVAPGARTDAAAIAVLEAWLDDAIEAGVDLIQIREPGLPAAALCGLVRRVVRCAAAGATRVVVNDRADVAVACGAHGVHVRGDGPAVERVRGLFPPDALIGRSIHAPGEATAHGAASYLLFGSVFESASKPAGHRVAGLEALRAAASVHGAVLAIGGVTVERARAVREAGARGVAAIGLFLPRGARPEAQGPARGVDGLRAAMAQVMR
jgi:thiamine-phosphate pyrophosphorylase